MPDMVFWCSSRGEWHSPFHDIDAFHLVLNQDLQDLQDYRGRRRFKFGGYL